MAGKPGGEVEPDGGADPRHGREQAIEALKAAFAQGRLGKDEFDQRVGQALAAYAELDELTADIPAAPPAAPPTVGPPQVTRDAYNRGLVARGTIGGACGVMLLVTIAVTVASGNPITGFLLGAAFGAVMAVVLGTFLTLIMWVLESSDGRSSRRTRPPQARSSATERLSSPGQDGLPGQPRQDGRHTAEAIRDHHLTGGCAQAWAKRRLRWCRRCHIRAAGRRLRHWGASGRRVPGRWSRSRLRLR